MEPVEPIVGFSDVNGGKMLGSELRKSCSRPKTPSTLQPGSQRPSDPLHLNISTEGYHRACGLIAAVKLAS